MFARLRSSRGANLFVELLMIVFPFTKLMHAFTIFLARWYNGAISGFRGVQS